MPTWVLIKWGHKANQVIWLRLQQITVSQKDRKKLYASPNNQRFQSQRLDSQRACTLNALLHTGARRIRGRGGISASPTFVRIGNAQRRSPAPSQSRCAQSADHHLARRR